MKKHISYALPLALLLSYNCASNAMEGTPQQSDAQKTYEQEIKDARHRIEVAPDAEKDRMKLGFFNAVLSHDEEFHDHLNKQAEAAQSQNPLQKLPETIELKSLINQQSIFNIALEKQEEQAQERMLTSNFFQDHIKETQAAIDHLNTLKSGDSDSDSEELSENKRFLLKFTTRIDKLTLLVAQGDKFAKYLFAKPDDKSALNELEKITVAINATTRKLEVLKTSSKFDEYAYKASSAFERLQVTFDIAEKTFTKPEAEKQFQSLREEPSHPMTQFALSTLGVSKLAAK